MYKAHLILKYLLKRRIAWVSLLAVMLCTTMVLVVISVMGGWLVMFKSSFRGLSGDIVIHADTLKGFPYYQQVIDAIEKDPQCHVSAATPSIETAGLFNHGTGPIPVRVMGMDIEHIDDVNEFGKSLFLQGGSALKDAENPTNSSVQKASESEIGRLKRELREPPSFDLHDTAWAPLDQLPPGLTYAKPAEGEMLAPGTIATPADFPAILKGRLRYEASRKMLVFHGPDMGAVAGKLKSLSPEPAFQKALDAMAAQTPFADYPPVSGKYNGLIVGTGVIGIRKNKDGVWDRPGQIEWERPTHLTVLDLSGNRIDEQSQVTRNFFIVDDSHLGVWQYDSNYVYVGFDVLQKDLGLDAQTVSIDGRNFEQPARATDVHIKVTKGIDPNVESKLTAARDEIQLVVHRVMAEQVQAHPEFGFDVREPTVETWQETQRIWINAVEHEKLLMVILFGIMCIVAIFLIFCIFFMIVVEKTRDIGIIKSVGATSVGVAQIFLGYGLVIGVIGAGMGLLLSYLIVHNINELHAWLANSRMHMRIWDPQVYLFDKIPNTISPTDVMWIVPIAVLASVLGALIPAIRAARLNPVDSLRWE